MGCKTGEMRGSWILLILVVLGLSSFASARELSCQIIYPATLERPELCMTWQWTQGPRGDGSESRSDMRFFVRATGEAYPLEMVPRVRLWMQMGRHGHGAPAPTVAPLSGESDSGAPQILPGAFSVHRMLFNMSGTWQIHVELPGPERRFFEEVVP